MLKEELTNNSTKRDVNLPIFLLIAKTKCQQAFSKAKDGEFLET